METEFKIIFEKWISNTLVNPKTGNIVRLDGIFNYLKYQNKKIYNYIMGIKFSESLKLNERMYLLYNGFDSRPKCYCGNSIKYFKGIDKGYGQFCSNKCQRENNYINWAENKHPFHRDGVQQKVRKTNLEKYGGETPFHSSLVQKKIINNNLMKFGFEKPNQRPEIKFKLKQSLKDFFSDDNNKREWIEKHNRFEIKRYSKIADNFFKQLIEDTKIDRREVQFSEDEFCLMLAEKDKFGRFAYYFDFKYNDLVIEFNGDIFHANPDIFESDETPNPWRNDLTSQTIWAMDEERINVIKNKGYDVLEIWESDVVQDIENELLKCKIYLEGNNK